MPFGIYASTTSRNAYLPKNICYVSNIGILDVLFYNLWNVDRIWDIWMILREFVEGTPKKNAKENHMILLFWIFYSSGKVPITTGHWGMFIKGFYVKNGCSVYKNCLKLIWREFGGVFGFLLDIFYNYYCRDE